MPREIKFRGKRLENGQWVYGYPYCWHSKRTAGRLKAFIHEVTFQDGLKTLDAQLEVDPNTVGQYTGLLDKNGKEIYEGDIIRECYTIFPDDMEVFISEVLFQNGSFQLSGEDYEPFGGDSSMCSVKSTDLEVIGNIYENSELLEDKNAKG